MACRSFRLRCCAAALLWLPGSLAAQDPPEALSGMDAAVRGDWAAACESFARANGDPRSSSRLTAARAQAVARLSPAIEQLTRQRRWRQLAEAAACGLLVDPHHYRFTEAAKRAAKEGVVDTPPVDARVRQWAAYGLDFGDAEQLIESCLDFLVKTQEPDGHWAVAKLGGNGAFDTGVTGLALLALASRRREAADRAAKALLDMQQDDGRFGSVPTSSWIYNHALATEALAEYALATGQGETYRDVLQRATGVLLSAQNPGAGWRYKARGGASDTSVTERVTCALDAARRVGVSVDPDAFAGAGAWVTSMTEPTFGQIGYNYPGGAPARAKEREDAFPPVETRSMTAAGCVVQLFADHDPFRLVRSIALVHEKLPAARYPDMYYWEAGARAWVAAYGQMPSDWYAALVKSATACRDGDGGMRACGPWGPDGGRAYASALCALALAAPYRVTPMLSARSFVQSGKCEVTVVGSEPATPTGIYVEVGMVLDVNASGTVCTYSDGPEIGPEGTRESPGGPSRPRDRKAPFGCLLGRIDDGSPFVLAAGKKNTMRGYGHLWLMVNEDSPSDNYGWWDVGIKRAP